MYGRNGRGFGANEVSGCMILLKKSGVVAVLFGSWSHAFPGFDLCDGSNPVSL